MPLRACRPPIGLWTCFFHKFPVSHHAIVNSLKWRVLVGQYFLVYLILIGWDRFLMALRPVLLIKTGNENTEEITRQATFLTVASLTHIIFAHKWKKRFGFYREKKFQGSCMERFWGNHLSCDVMLNVCGKGWIIIFCAFTYLHN